MGTTRHFTSTGYIVNDGGGALGGSEYLAQVGGSDGFPALPENASEIIETIAAVANQDSTLASHDVSHGGLAVMLAELITDEVGADVSVDSVVDLFDETPGLVVIETTDAEAVREAFDVVAPVDSLGSATDNSVLSLTVGDETVGYDAESGAELRSVITSTLA